MKTAALLRAVEKLEAASDPDLRVYTLEQLVVTSYGKAPSAPAGVRKPGRPSAEELILAVPSVQP